jgi:hypothetical protein
MSIDTRKLVAEIEDEVRRKRATGELPADLERELDAVFARYAPVGALDLDFEHVMAKIEESTVIDTIAPADSSRPIIPKFKVVVRKAIGWYIRWIANQVSTMVQALARALRLLGERVDALEAQSPGPVPEAASVPSSGDLAHWHDTVGAALTEAGLAGRVLHADAGDGGLVAHLVAAGVDAYGVEPDDDLALEAAARSLDVRADDVIAHLQLLDNAALAGIVLSGCVDRFALGAQLRLVELAAAKLMPGGTLVILGTDPQAWVRERSPVQVDLSPGRPLHAETWAALGAGRGFTVVRTDDGPAGPALAEVAADVSGADVINANLSMLNRTLFRPATYAVVARRTAS